MNTIHCLVQQKFDRAMLDQEGPTAQECTRNNLMFAVTQRYSRPIPSDWAWGLNDLLVVIDVEVATIVFFFFIRVRSKAFIGVV